MTPIFIVRFDKMRPRARFPPRHDPNGRWLPPKQLGGNERDGGDSTGKFYYFNGNTVNEVSAVPEGWQQYRTLSIYFDHDNFWTVPYDAIMNEVAGGGEQEAVGDDDDDDEEEEDAPGEDAPGADETWSDWSDIGFNYEESTYGSKVWVGGSNTHLLTQRPDQYWVPELFPDRYHAEMAMRTGVASYGALVGDISVLLALVALSVRRDMIENALRTCIRPNGWVHHGQPRRAGWANRRGLVVYVYCRDRMELFNFERGLYGNCYH